MLNEFYNNQIKNLSAELLLLKEQYNKLVNLNEEEASAREYNPRTFDTVLAPHEEQLFSKFMAHMGRSIGASTHDYDMRGFYADHVTPEEVGTETVEGEEVPVYKFNITPGVLKSKEQTPRQMVDQTTTSIQFPETYKKPNHPTFSTKSKYHGQKDHTGKIHLGGEWKELGDKNWSFTPHPNQINTPQEESRLISYFREVQPSNVLVHPTSNQVLHHPNFISNEKDESIGIEDYAQMRGERLKSIASSEDLINIGPIDMDSLALQKFLGVKGGGAVGGGKLFGPSSVKTTVPFPVADIAPEGGLSPEEFERMKQSGAFERQLTRGVFGPKAKLSLDPLSGKYRFSDTQGNQIKISDLSTLLTRIPETDKLKASQAEFETITGLEDAGEEVKHKGSSIGFSTRETNKMLAALYPDAKTEYRDYEERTVQPALMRSYKRSKEDLMADHARVLADIDAHVQQHDITQKEMDAVEGTSHEDIKQLVRDLATRTTKGKVESTGRIKTETSPVYKRARALRDLKSKFVLSDNLQSSIDNYESLPVESEPPFDPAERLDPIQRKAGMMPVTDPAMRRGERGIGIEEYPPSPDLKARMGGAAGYGDQQIVALRGARGEMYREAEQRRRAEELAPDREAIKQARLAKIEKDLADLKIQSQIEAGRDIERQNAKRERTDLSSLNLTADELRDLADRPYEDAREIETGLSAKEIRRIGPSRKKKSSSYVRKALRAEREAAAQFAMERGAEEAKVLDRRKAQERADLESMLSKDFPDLERERYSAVTPEKVSGPGADLARDLAFRASARRKGVPLADRPEFVRYLGEAVLNISRARTIS
jgi:hypothetical protein